MPAAPPVLRPPDHRPGYALVALDRPLDHALTYLVPEAVSDGLRVGSVVEVELRGQVARGVVLSFGEKPEFKGPIKPIRRHLTPDFTIAPQLISLAEWIAEYYWCAPGEALAAVSFLGLNDVHEKTRSHLALASPEHFLTVSRELAPDGRKLTEKQARVVAELLAGANEAMPPAELRDLAGVGAGVLDTLLERGVLERVQEPVHRDDDYDKVADDAVEARASFELNPAQAAALAAIEEAGLRAREAKAGSERQAGRSSYTFLLQGVTGSGKTEVYLRAVESELRHGRGAIMLLPEIALTPQTVATFRRRLGGRVGVYHSRLTLGQKYDLWRRVRSGEARVIVGARSAVFSPIPDLGLVVVDEEHESSYKNGETPRYHARDLAVLRAAREGAVAVLGSATPSLESWHNAREGKYRLLELPERVGPHASPHMTVVDMKRHIAEGIVYRKNDANVHPAVRLGPEEDEEEGARTAAPGARASRPHEAPESSEDVSEERAGGPRTRSPAQDEGAESGFGGASLISPPLRDAIRARLEAGEQSVLLLNRRGFSNQVLCLRCEKPLKCPHCDINLVWHKRLGRLMCHWCGHESRMPEACPDPKCGAPELLTLGVGTQRVEETLAALFPTARVLRVDVDSMKGRRAFQDAWERISRREVDIVLGTQMIAKGLHLENVTLAAVVSADFALFLPDFRSAERTFQLLTQVAGRAGRGDRPGEVIVQSFMPHHYAIEHAARLAQKAFYEKELHIRKVLRFPPIHRLVAVLVACEDPGLAKDQAARLANMLKSLAWRKNTRETSVLGPAPAPIAKLKDEWRWRILLRGPSWKDLHRILKEGMTGFEKIHDRKARVVVDVDPVDLL